MDWFTSARAPTFTRRLRLQASENYYFNLSPAMLNLLNVRWFAVPLEPRLTDRGTAPYASLALDVSDKTVQFAPTAATAIQIDSFTEGAAKLPAGSIAANVSVRFDDGSTQVFPLHVGVETADWDWGQADGTNAPPRQAQVAHPVSAFVRSVGHSFEGYVYRAQLQVGFVGAIAQGGGARRPVRRRAADAIDDRADFAD